MNADDATDARKGVLSVCRTKGKANMVEDKETQAEQASFFAPSEDEIEVAMEMAKSVGEMNKRKDRECL